MKAKKLLVIAVALIIIATPIALKVYGSQNMETPKMPTRSSPIKVALVGDSITQDSEYPADLQVMLGSNYSVGNFGSRESTVLRTSWKPYINQSQFQSALDFHPDIVVIMLGTNDGLSMLHPYRESFDEDYTALVTAFQQLDGDQQVYIAKSPPIFSNSTDLSPTYHSETIIPKTEDVANKLNLPIIDVYSTFADHIDYLREDGVHPNSQGSAVIASDIYTAISEEGSSIFNP